MGSLASMVCHENARVGDIMRCHVCLFIMLAEKTCLMLVQISSIYYSVCSDRIGMLEFFKRMVNSDLQIDAAEVLVSSLGV